MKPNEITPDLNASRVYLAGPLLLEASAINIRNVLTVADRLLLDGHIPHIPHLTWFWHLVKPHNSDVWLEYDLHWLSLCDVLFHLPGQSAGTQVELKYANEHNIPVFNEYEQLSEWLKTFGAINTKELS